MKKLPSFKMIERKVECLRQVTNKIINSLENKSEIAMYNGINFFILIIFSGADLLLPCVCFVVFRVKFFFLIIFLKIF